MNPHRCTARRAGHQPRRIIVPDLSQATGHAGHLIAYITSAFSCFRVFVATDRARAFMADA